MRVAAFLLAAPVLLTGCAAEEWTCRDPDGCPVPPFDPHADVRILLGGEYREHEEVEVRIKNDGAVGYRYRTHYAACDMSYFTEEGRRFLIPQGTHCDIANEATLEPGEVALLFVWHLAECIEDQWGCVQEEPLPPGVYHVRGNFTAEFPGKVSVSGAGFRIVAET